MRLVAHGRMNKQVGGELGISEFTVKAHRGQVMRKMKAGSLPDLVKMLAGLELTPAAASPSAIPSSYRTGPETSGVIATALHRQAARNWRSHV
ncbi:MAG: LuxR C-terminal-related transcriptional regulator [Gammaproteobacteria bacterium]